MLHLKLWEKKTLRRNFSRVIQVIIHCETTKKKKKNICKKLIH